MKNLRIPCFVRQSVQKANTCKLLSYIAKKSSKASHLRSLNQIDFLSFYAQKVTEVDYKKKLQINFLVMHWLIDWLIVAALSE